MGTNSSRDLSAWLELAHGSHEREREIEAAVDEMMALAHMGIDALCRHLPQHEPAIRLAIHHVLTHPECLRGSPCPHDWERSPN